VRVQQEQRPEQEQLPEPELLAGLVQEPEAVQAQVQEVVLVADKIHIKNQTRILRVFLCRNRSAAGISTQ
jgi:hypothetical protein